MKTYFKITGVEVMSSRNKKISEKRYAEDRRQFKRDEA